MMAKILKYDYRLNGLLDQSPTEYNTDECKQIHAQFDEWYETINLDLYDREGYNRFGRCLVELFWLKFILERANNEIKDRDFGEILEQLYSEVDAIDVSWQYVLEVFNSDTVTVPNKKESVLPKLIKTIIYAQIENDYYYNVTNNDAW